MLSILNPRIAISFGIVTQDTVRVVSSNVPSSTASILFNS
jgi:hypothetical protein